MQMEEFTMIQTQARTKPCSITMKMEDFTLILKTKNSSNIISYPS
uniref:Uncharacterized protein n=1 Tax=Brassica oleracea TaxID=3712 RepID=A0A3P6DJV9_BRAOL|nr:unnamed protein product [Brassica oleracea]